MCRGPRVGRRCSSLQGLAGCCCAGGDVRGRGVLVRALGFELFGAAGSAGDGAFAEVLRAPVGVVEGERSSRSGSGSGYGSGPQVEGVQAVEAADACAVERDEPVWPAGGVDVLREDAHDAAVARLFGVEVGRVLVR